MGICQAQSYISQTEKEDQIRKIRQHENQRFVFGDANHKCLGTLDLCIPVAGHPVITSEAYVVSIYMHYAFDLTSSIN